MDLQIYTDGGSRGNPGPAAFALLIYDNKGNLIENHSEYIGENTNNVAEYRGILKALKMARKHSIGNVVCTMDSKLAVMQLSGRYKVKKPHLLELFEMVKHEEKAFASVKYIHVNRWDKHISLADSILNRTLDRVNK